MAKKSVSSPLPLFLSIALMVAGLFASVLLVKQSQRITTSAAEPLVLISPNGGESWQRGQTYQIRWRQTQKQASTSLFIYTRNGSTDTYIGAIAYNVSNVLGTNAYSWTIPLPGSAASMPPDGSNIIVSVAQYNPSGKKMYEDKSNNPFTISTPKPTLTSPNGGEIWQRGQTYQITWNQTIKLASKALLIYTRNTSGDTYIGAIAYNVSNNVGSNSYSWTIPQLGGAQTTPPDGNNIIVSVGQYNSSGQLVAEDKSNSTFTITTPKPVVTSPNGGETWERGKTYKITWNQTVKLASTGLFIYTRGTSGDAYIGAIAYNVSNLVGTNSYSWTIPFTGGSASTPPDGSNIIISVGQYNSNSQLVVEDKSDSPFTITTPKPTLTTPNGGEVWTRGNTYKITWNQTAAFNSTGLFLYTRSSTGVDTYLGAIAYYVSNLIGANYYNWTIPALGGPVTTPPDGNNIIVSVAQYNSAGSRVNEDKSDNTFTVVSP